MQVLSQDMSSADTGAAITTAGYTAQRMPIEAESINDAERIIDKSHLKPTAPIAILPLEIIVEIFTHCARLYCGSLSGPYKWIVITHVCAQWRAIALACPKLWCNIFVARRQDWLVELLRRSKQMPLTVTADFASRAWKEVGRKQITFEMVAKEMARIKSLNIHASRPIARSLLKTLNGPMPLLQTLVICGPEWLLDRSRVQIPTGTSLPILLHSGHSTGLQRLDIRFYPIRWKSLVSLSLKHLTVRSIGEAAQTSLSDVLKAAESMPLLETLDLEDVIVPDSATFTAPNRTAVLPLLRSLRLVADFRDCTYILYKLSFPNLNALTLCSLFPSLEALRDLATCLIARLPFTAELSEFSIHGSGFDAASPGRSLDSSHGMGGVTQNIEVKRIQITSRTEMFTARSFTDLCEVFPVKQVTTLNVDDAVYNGSNDWLRVLPLMKKVKHMRVSGTLGAETMLHMLMPRPRTNPTVRKPKCCFRRLRTLSLGGVLLRESIYKEGISDDLVELLRDCLMQRYESGAKISDVHLIRCINVRQAEVDLLREIAVSVFWDGIVIVHGGEEDDSEDDSDL
ncbi:uncharacterized protein LAESUDRAFT_810937 [Laetiporus sulphureus 93-53]|uniref:Uncharacterized protein n=1 Tax=Laetiporus sulphureus 93-53 TaxID=1314785 RepID=A0A165FRR3_9APHY|nr:uncharacterized protein LAESUDRAFT_810937 [Laetiporus sulphureus 93-53]KZT09331.1 hypothetical protein LAESUDRAFT_810937 [Laetiporus sulphureus 93-53]